VPNKKTGAVGFCFGGGMVWNMLNAKNQQLSAAVPFYGPCPENPDFTGIKAATLGIYGALDARVNASKDRAEAALKAAGVPYEIKVYEGADHAFFNDTGARYNAKAAAEANTAMLDWFQKYL
jgi:carboxymethylenebutenolidase